MDPSGRSAPDADRCVAPSLQPGRAPAARERPARRDEPGRPAAGAARVRGGVSAQAARLHAPPQGQSRHDRLGADQWLAGQHLAREAPRVRPLLHRAVVTRIRSENHRPDLLARILDERLLSGGAANLPRQRPLVAGDRLRLILLGAFAVGLAVSITLAETALAALTLRLGWRVVRGHVRLDG